jgi:hypothetical protein
MFYKLFHFQFDRSYGIATDIRETVVITMIITAFEQQTIWEFIQNLEIHTHWSDRIS